MFGRTAASTLDLRIEGDTLRFESPRAFEFALEGRTSVPAAKLANLVTKEDRALVGEAEKIRAVEKLIAAAVAGALDDVSRIGGFMRDLDLTMVSKDHGWREIVRALNDLPNASEEYKKVALVKYMQYLTCRQEVIRSVFSNRHSGDDSPPGSEETDGGAVGKDTVILDLTTLVDGPAGEEDFRRLPKGETVEITMEPEVRAELRLARHDCALVMGDTLVFVDTAGREHALRRGRSVIGRDKTADVVIDSSLRDVSRKHLVVETDGEFLVRLTDISSHGTSVDKVSLETTSI